MSHSRKTRSPGRAALAALTLLASLLSCGREITGPGGAGGVAQLNFAPDYSSMIDEVDGVMHSVAALLPFNRVRIELRRADNSIAASQVVPFPETATEVPLSITVQLGSTADASGETLTAFLRYINAAGDTVFAGGPITVLAVPGSGGTAQQPIEIPIVPTAPGAVFARLDISPDSATGNSGATLTFTAAGYDAQNAVVPNAVIGFISRNPSIAAVPTLGQGTVNLVAVRGETWIVAQSLTGLKDSARVRVLPVPTQITKISGDAQTALQSIAFAQGLRVRVLAADNLAVAGSTVNFAVTAGGGTLSAASAQTDINGFAEVIWSAGTLIGQGGVTATVGSGTITTAFTGTQVNAGPTSLVFESQPLTIVSGDTLPPIRVAVRNALGQAITGFTGSVSLTRVGTGAGRLVGDTAAVAVAGVATFRGLTVDRAGTDYRLSAALAGVPNQLSNIFVVAPAPPSSLVLVGGAGQISDPSTALPAPIAVRVTNFFGQPVVGATVTFAVQAGGGSVNPVTVPTDANGLASTQWTLGASGAQQLSVSVGALSALNVTAAIRAAGGPPELFAGYDSTRVRITQTRSIPLYLSNGADTAITVTLSTSAAGLQWASSTVQFPAQTRQVNVNMSAGASLLPGTYWALVTSAVGNDSIEISVDSAFVQLADPYWDYVFRRDTVHLPLRLSDPAPAGGVTVRVRSLNPQTAKVIAGTGARTPVPSCLDAEYCYYGSLQETVGVPDDSVEIFIPAGELLGHVAFIVKDTTANAVLGFQATSPTYMASSVTFYLWDYTLSVDFDGNSEYLGVGHINAARIRHNGGSTVQDRVVRLRSLTPGIFTVDSATIVPRLENYSTRFQLFGVSAGVGQLEYGSAQDGYDTVLVRVAAPRLWVNGNVDGVVQSERYITVHVGVGNSPFYQYSVSNLPITLISRSPNIVRLERASVTVRAGESGADANLRVVGAGSTWLVATAPGYAPDSLLFTGINSFVSINTAGGPYVGVGTTTRFTAQFFAQSGRFGSARVLEARPRNAARARVVTPFVSMTEANGGIARFDLVGLSVGNDTMDFFFADTLVASSLYWVNQASVLLNTSASQASELEPDSNFTYLVGGILVESVGGQIRAAADTVRAVLRSSDPSVVRVVDSTFTFLPGEDLSAATASGSYVALRPGTSTLSLSAPGFIAGTLVHTVQPSRLVIAGGGAGYVAGIGTLHNLYLRRNSATTTTLPLTVTQQGPGRVGFVPAVTGIPANSEFLPVDFTGVTTGVDTVIFSAPNHTPDTLFVEVFPSTAQFSIDPFVYSGQIDSSLTAFFQASLSYFGYPSQPRRFRVTSLDTSKARVLQDTIQIGATGPTRYAAVRYRNPGRVTLVMTDLDGISPPDSVEVRIEQRQLYGYTDHGEYYLPIGMRQRSYDENMYVEIDFETDKDLWVRLTASRPGLISLPDSVRIPAGESYVYFDVAARDTVGGVRVTASHPGFIPWEFDVVVSHTLLQVYTDEPYVGGTSSVYIETVDALELQSRPLAVATSVRLTSDRPDIVSIIMPELTIPADSEYVYAPALRGQALGSTLIRATDSRTTAFSAFAPNAQEVSAYNPFLTPYSRQYVASPGLLSTSTSHGLGVSAIRDSIWVRLSSKQGRFQPSADSIRVDLGDFSSSPNFGLRGITAGIDTLVFTATGFPSAESLVRIEPGILLLEPGTPTVVTMGDSTLVRVNFAAADGAPGAIVSTPSTLNYGYLSASTQQVLIPSGATSASFWVRPSAPGLGTFEVSASGFRPLRVTLEARTRP